MYLKILSPPASEFSVLCNATLFNSFFTGHFSLELSFSFRLLSFGLSPVTFLFLETQHPNLDIRSCLQSYQRQVKQESYFKNFVDSCLQEFNYFAYTCCYVFFQQRCTADAYSSYTMLQSPYFIFLTLLCIVLLFFATLVSCFPFCTRTGDSSSHVQNLALVSAEF